MASKLLEQSVSRGEVGWDFRCPGIAGSVCGDPAVGAGFTSTGWPTKAIALDRGREHFNQHLLGAEILEAQKTAIAAAVASTEPGEEVLVELDIAQVIADSEYEPMTTLEDFRAKHGLGVDDDGNAITLEDLK